MRESMFGMKFVGICLFSFAVSNVSSAHNVDLDQIKNFKIEPPHSSTMVRLSNMWATYYYVPIFPIKGEGFPLLSSAGRKLGPFLARDEWCSAALEGTVAIEYSASKTVVYNYAGTGSWLQVECGAYYKFKKSGKVRFRLAKGPYGDGAKGFILYPYRTVAVRNIPYGSVVYIPEARGIVIPLKNGREFIHDGYFFAADTGGGLRINQIDIFQGVEKSTGLSRIIKNSRRNRLKIYIVKSEPTRKALNKAHQMLSTDLTWGDF